MLGNEYFRGGPTQRAIYKDNEARQLVVVVHNNFVVGLAAKVHCQSHTHHHSQQPQQDLHVCFRQRYNIYYIIYIIYIIILYIWCGAQGAMYSIHKLSTYVNATWMDKPRSLVLVCVTVGAGGTV